MKYILLHGMGQNASSWDKTISYLSDKAATIPLELSELFGEGDCTYSKMYVSFCEYCNSISEPLNLCGLSLGAVLALNYAMDFTNAWFQGGVCVTAYLFFERLHIIKSRSRRNECHL